MSKDFQLVIKAHRNIYKLLGNKERSIDVYISEPNTGINADTGIVVFASSMWGGGEPYSGFQTKLRKKYSDKYNFVAIQCNYFGQKYLRKPDQLLHAKDVIENIVMKDKKNENIVVFNDSIDDFADMSYLQAMDIIYSVLYTYNYYANKINTGKIVFFGSSHGIYLGLLCNAYAPGLFSHIVGGWPWEYAGITKEPQQYIENKATFIFNRITSKIMEPHNFSNLGFLYQNFQNRAQIIIYHGIDDQTLSFSRVTEIFANVENVSIICVDNEFVESSNGMFTNTQHGLGANLYKLFEKAIGGLAFEKIYKLSLNTVVEFFSDNEWFRIDYSKQFPELCIGDTKQ